MTLLRGLRSRVGLGRLQSIVAVFRLLGGLLTQMSEDRGHEMVRIEYRSEVFEQDGQYVAICPELNVSSFDDTPESAEASLEEAVAAFLEGCEMLGTLGEVLEESGFTKANATWRLSERVSSERVTVLP